MLFLIVVVLGGFVLMPFAKRQAVKRGVKFSFVKHFTKVAALAIAVMIGGFIKELYFTHPKQSFAPKNVQTPVNVQSNL